MKDNIYQYNNIAYLGILIFLSFFIINNFLSIFRYQGLFESINKIIDSMSYISFYLFPIGMIILTYIGNNPWCVIIKERRKGKNEKKVKYNSINSSV